MYEAEMTSADRECLRGWMRQAIAELELREVATQFIENQCLEPTGNRHRSSLIKRRNPRNRNFAHVRELVT